MARKGDHPLYHVRMDPISGKHQIGAVLAGLGWFIVFRRALVLAPAQPHSFDRLICVFLACGLLTYAWGVLMALVARRRGWTPRGCSLSGLPLWALGLFALVGDPHIKVILDVGGLALSSDLAGRWRRRLAFPELGWSGKDPEPSLSINPRPPSQPDTFGGRS